ncbi:MAG: NTP transferase domain-containing protein [Chloroflexaceae bacterium]|nr:NTP transferase domain-containing protein [Chloroflexaceae bacterium]
MAYTPPQQACITRHAIILAAGESKRTRPLTLQRPKPLIPLLDRPLLAHIMDQLVGLATRVTLVVGYRADMLRAFFGRTYRGMALDYVTQYAINGTAGALLAVEDAVTAGQIAPVDGSFFLLYGDNLISQIDVVGVCQQRYSLAALPVGDPSAFGVLDVAGQRVQRIIEKPPDAPPGSLANPGIYHFDAQVFAALHEIAPSPRGEYELTDLIALLAGQHPVGYHVCQGVWIPIGTPWDVLIATQFLLQQRAHLAPAIDPTAHLAPDCTIEGYVQIGASSVIGAGCQIVGPAFIGAGVTVGAGCTIERSVIGSQSTTGTGCYIRNSALIDAVLPGPACMIDYSVLDMGATVGEGGALQAQHVADVRPVAATGGLVDVTTMQQRGVVLGQGVIVAAGQLLEAGTVVFPGA